MNQLIQFLRSCPTITTGTLTAIVSAGIAALIAFGADLTQDQQIAVVGLVAAIAPLIVGGITHAQTVPSTQVIAHQDPRTGDAIAGQAASETTGTPIEVVTEPKPVEPRHADSNHDQHEEESGS